MGALKNVLWSRPLTHRACGSPMALPWLPLWGQTIGRDAQVPWPLLDLPLTLGGAPSMVSHPFLFTWSPL